MERPVRPRRRVVRRAEVDYDRTADAPGAGASLSKSSDDQREVILDEDGEPHLTGLDFYEAEKPPHY